MGHGVAAGGRVELEKRPMDAGGLEIRANGSRCGGAALDAGAAIQTYVGTRLWPVFSDEIHRIVPPTLRTR